MELQALLSADYLDIVFDNRNKKYGGYILRKTYQKRMITSLAVIVLGAATFAAFALNRSDEVVRNVPVICTLPAIDPIPFDPPKPQPKTPIAINTPKVDMTKFATPVIAKDDVVDEPPADLSGKVPGPKNTDGREGDVSIVGDSDSTSVPPVNTTPPAPEPPVRYAEVMPEFNGDLGEYLGKKLMYPTVARENGIEGTVTVQFVVAEDGSVSNAKVLRGVAGGCNEEALRVVSSMPKWKPGKQNGHAVKVYYTLPIRFVLQ